MFSHYACMRGNVSSPVFLAAVTLHMIRNTKIMPLRGFGASTLTLEAVG